MKVLQKVILNLLLVGREETKMGLLTRLGEIQSENGYLPIDQIQQLSEEFGQSLSEIIGTASFYEYFNLEQAEQQNHIEKLYPCQKRGALLNYECADFSAIKKCINAPERIIDEVEKAGLRGRSGSGFLTAAKWKITAEAEADEKYIVCNADEGEPGTGKDRVILELIPEVVVEGMAIAALAVHAKKGIIYLREEYQDLRERLEHAILSMPKMDFEVQIFMGHGAYVCGEETALLNSIEGKRGEPRLKPPFPGTSGLFGKPTVINNVETFACVPFIIKNGADKFREFGTKEYPGPKLFTIFGDVQNPGVYELSPGITLRECIAEAGGATDSIKAILTGGGSGSLLNQDYLDMKMTPEFCNEMGATFGVASIRVLGEHTDLVKEVRELINFYIRESCGTCTPCRNGLQQVARILEKMASGSFDEFDKSRLENLLTYISGNARCGFGQAAVTPVKTLLLNFQEVMG